MLAALMITALVVVAVAGVHLGSAVVARHRAQAAADLAALAAAARLPSGPAAACRQALGVSRAMGGALDGCEVDELDVKVSVVVMTGGWIGGWARAAARAGPAAR